MNGGHRDSGNLLFLCAFERVSHALNENSMRYLGLKMCWPPIGWSFVRGKIQIAMVVGRVCRVVVGEGSFIQRRHSINEKTVVKSGSS